MKLEIEIIDREYKDGSIFPFVGSKIVPIDDCEGISAHDKLGQVGKLARLIDVANLI